jgi:hypothetical protein
MGGTDKLTKLSSETHERIALRTPQVASAVQDAVSVLRSATSPSILSVSGRPGSGLSAAMDGIFEALQSNGDVAVFKLKQTVADTDVMPTEKLLRHFGFAWDYDAVRSTAARPLSKPIQELANMLGPSILLVEDYRNDVGSRQLSNEYLKICERLTASPCRLRVVLVGPNQSVSKLSGLRDAATRDLYIREWQCDQSLIDYLDRLSIVIKSEFGLSVQLSKYAIFIHKLSIGNTARMLEFIRQVAIHCLLTRSTEIPGHLFNLSLKDLVYSNACIHSSLARL